MSKANPISHELWIGRPVITNEWMLNEKYGF